MGGLRGATWRVIPEFATKRSRDQDYQDDPDDCEGTQGETGEAAVVPRHLDYAASRAASGAAVELIDQQGPGVAEEGAEDHATCPHVGPREKISGGVAAPSHRGDDASRVGSGAAKNLDHRQGPEEAEAATGEGGARPRPVTPEGVPAAATKAAAAAPKPAKARKGYTPYKVVERDALLKRLERRRVAEKAAGAGKRVPEMAKGGGKTGTTVSQPELSPEEEKARVERMVAERNARARQQAVREKRVAAMTIRPEEAPRVQKPTEGEQGRTLPNQTVREEDDEEEEERETTQEPPRPGRVPVSSWYQAPVSHNESKILLLKHGEKCS
ncbi:hypothetical protein DD237_007397 [Peronospora effusa]|uniref:Uncharacterized protein n=1 Tax=Peronospora effusa TaxID=542832 RepID=A0A3R7WR77_9STRA|nr:hypothetical protein DD237_007397 [Peronospora effusa]